MPRRFPLLLLLLFVAHWGFVARYAVDIPYWDEWDNILAWEPKLSFSWLITVQNEHRLVPTRLQMWLFGRLFGANLWLQLVFNFLLYGIALGALYRLLRRAAPTLGAPQFAAFFIFLLSFISWENHVNGLHSVFHYTLLFFVLGVHCLFFSSRPLLGGTLLCLSAYSQASGVVVALVTWLVFLGFAIQRKRIQEAFLAGIPAVGIVALWFLGHPMLGGHIPHPPMFSDVVVLAFLDAVSFGFGAMSLNALLGLFCFLLLFVPFVALWYRDRGKDDGLWALTALLFGIFGILGAIAVGRSGLPPGAIKSSRYAEYASVLVPLAAVLWHKSLSTAPAWRKRALVSLWIFAFIGYYNKWDPSPYRMNYRRRMRGLECMQKNFATGPRINCADLYPASMEAKWEIIERLSPRFYRRLLERHRAEGASVPSGTSS